jgi:hypothetical protein
MKISHFPVRFSRRMVTVTAAAGAAAVLGVTATVAVASGAPARAHGFSFRLVPSAGISSCLPHARGNVTITPQGENDKMVVHVAGLPRNSEFDLFVIQVPDKPFGVAWYQSDIDTGRGGTGSVTVRGIFDAETFSVSLGGTTTFGPTHQFHLGLWFNDPRQPFRLGCEPGATSPIVTPFNGEQHAGIQVLNTGQFPDNAGPLRHVHR